MKILKNLAKSGRTIVQTIHQPNSEIYELFDKLLLISCGKILYFNEKDKAVEYFASINFMVPDLTNPADYFMSIMSIESLETDEDANEDKQVVAKRI